jgi:hypothetical protein
MVFIFWFPASIYHSQESYRRQKENLSLAVGLGNSTGIAIINSGA